MAVRRRWAAGGGGQRWQQQEIPSTAKCPYFEVCRVFARHMVAESVRDFASGSLDCFLFPLLLPVLLLLAPQGPPVSSCSSSCCSSSCPPAAPPRAIPNLNDNTSPSSWRPKSARGPRGDAPHANDSPYPRQPEGSERCRKWKWQRTSSLV